MQVNAQRLAQMAAVLTEIPNFPQDDPNWIGYRYAGFFQRGGSEWTPELLIEAVKAADRIESPLSRVRFLQITGISGTVIPKHFAGGWAELVDRAEIEWCFRARRYWTEEALLAEYHRVVGTLGRLPTLIEFEALSQTTRQTLRRLGNRAEVVDRYHAWRKANGFEFPTAPEGPAPERYLGEDVVKGTWTRERLIAAARTADRASPDPLSMPRFCEVAEVSNFTIYRLFPEGWGDLVRTAGIRENSRAKRHTDDDLLRLYHELKQQLGRHPTANQLRRLASVSHTTYRNRFGGMRELRERYEEWLAQ